MSISLRLSDKEANLIKTYAELNNVSVSELIRQAVLEKIEDEYDLDAFNKAYLEYEQDKTTYSLDEVKKELGL